MTGTGRQRGVLSIAWLTLLALAAACSQSEGPRGEEPATETEPPIATTMTQSTTAATTETTKAEGTTIPTSATTTATAANAGRENVANLVLSASLSPAEIGNGAGVACGPLESNSPDVAMWSWRLDERSQIEAGEPVVLCLYGFRQDEEVTIRVSADSTGVDDGPYTTVLVPSEGARSHLSVGFTAAGLDDEYYSPAAESSEFLFSNDAARPVFVEDEWTQSVQGDVLATNDFTFAPAMVNEIVSAGGFEIRATQGDLAAEEFVVVSPRGRCCSDAGAYWFEATNASEEDLIVSGYPPGTTVPLGLYEVIPDPDMAEYNEQNPSNAPPLYVLVQEQEPVVIGNSGLAFYTLRNLRELADGSGEYCLVGPNDPTSEWGGWYSNGACFQDGTRNGATLIGPP